MLFLRNLRTSRDFAPLCVSVVVAVELALFPHRLITLPVSVLRSCMLSELANALSSVGTG